MFSRIFMKKLILIRHAKSSWKHDVIDHERPLNSRGVKDVELMSNHLKEKGLQVDLVLSSDAVRAKTTANGIISNLNIDKKLVYLNHDLYDFSGYNLVGAIKGINETVNNVLIFGHNNAITSFVNTYGDKYIENVPTCGVVIIKFNIKKWENLNKGMTLKTVFPRDLKN